MSREIAPQNPPPEYDDDFTDECGNCGGEGYVYNCIDGCCVNAEDGCELCAARCDWCNPRRAPTDNKGEAE
jgi:hypothetical protein